MAPSPSDSSIARLNSIVSHLQQSAKDDPALEKSEWKDVMLEIKKRQVFNQTVDANDRGYIRQKTQGKLWVRDRIDRFVDPGTFYEVGSIAAQAKYDSNGKLVDYSPANFIAGKAKVNGRDLIIAGDDFCIRGGHADGAVWGKSLYAEQMALVQKIPIVRLIDGSSGGGSVTTMLTHGMRVPPLIGMHDVISSLSVIPVAAAALGPAVGLGAARATLTHFSVIPQKIGSLFAAGPPVVANATFETVTKESLGGALVHTANGTIDNLAVDEDDCFAQIRLFLSYLPNNNTQMPPVATCDDPVDRCDQDLLDIIPRRRQRPYQVRDIIIRVVDKGSWFEIGARWGDGAVCGLARIHGYPVGVIAFDGSKQGNVLSSASSQKFRRHLDLCDVFGLPVVNFADYAGFSIGTQAEREATIRHGATVTAALYQCDVPYFTVILRKVFGVAGAAFVDNRVPNQRVAWPSGDWGSLPLEGGIAAAHKRELEAAGDKRQEVYNRILAEYEVARSPVRTAEHFDIQELIDPRHTRPLVCEWVRMQYENVLPSRLEKVRVNGPRILYRP
ncbi:propionyl-CoA carboxylase [Hesseltinella vesiculosa]|uniref:Propionyl-CoA carboxylase n=1 Tax=Hesseltinella vesiculosa TaxID=101127 RepID=A0A1X2G5J1_9FUNG|nr:propionyl-CoA carboxylase [Hesseltinella vesiculosa]